MLNKIVKINQYSIHVKVLFVLKKFPHKLQIENEADFPTCVNTVHYFEDAPSLWGDVTRKRSINQEVNAIAVGMEL